MPLDQARIVRHEVSPTCMRLSLTRYSDEFYAGLQLNGFGERIYTVGRWRLEQKAREGYKEIREKLERGEYKLHIHSNGKVELKVE